MKHSETLTLIQEAINSNMSDWEKIVRVRKISSIAYQDDIKDNSPTLEEIKNQIVEHSGIPFEHICRRSRDRNIVTIRQLAHFKAARDTKYILSDIGFFFGGHNHSTVISSCKTIQNLLDTDKRFRNKHQLFLIQ